MGIGLCDNLDLIDLVMWDMTGDFGRWTERIGDLGRSNTSSRSGVRERPSESLKLFSLGMVAQVVVAVVMEERDRGGKIESLVFGSPLCDQQAPGVHQKPRWCSAVGIPHPVGHEYRKYQLVIGLLEY